MKNEGMTSFFKGLVPKVCTLPDNRYFIPLIDFVAAYDRTQTGLFFLACANTHTSFRYSTVQEIDA